MLITHTHRHYILTQNQKTYSFLNAAIAFTEWMQYKWDMAIAAIRIHPRISLLAFIDYFQYLYLYAVGSVARAAATHFSTSSAEKEAFNVAVTKSIIS